MSVYHQDGLHSIHNHEFMEDPDFVLAYARGVKAAGLQLALARPCGALGSHHRSKAFW